MNKHDLVATVANLLKCQLKDVEPVIDAMAAVVQAALNKGDEVTLHGIGKLKVAHRKARTGRNPSTGEVLQIAAKKTPAFSASKALKDATSAG